jgi:ATPase subunit of ABC transporter with duplicated ATPase domains
MAASLIVRDLTLGFDPVVLAEGVTATFAPGSVVGLVGPNGGGKTTLLKTLAGMLPISAGSITRAPPDATIGYLPQEIYADIPSQRQQNGEPTETAKDFLLRRTGVGEAQTSMESHAVRMAAAEPGADNDYGDALDRWLALGGADFDARIDAVIADVGLAIDLGQSIHTLSGGQGGRLGLASLLLARFDVFLLDEPTNNLDLAGLDRLERLVRELRAATVIVSHDRVFLENVATHILELDPIEKRATWFGGGYAAYIEEREVQRRHAREAFDEYSDTKSDLLDRARTVRNWTFDGVKKAKNNRPDNDKIGAKNRAESSEKMAGKASRLEKQANRLEVVDEPRKVWDLQYSIANAQRSGSLVSSLRDATISRGSFTMGPVSLDIHAGDRVAIIGANGSGKTTLLGAILQRVTLTTGESRLGSGVVVGELDQARNRFDANSTLLDSVRGLLPKLTIPEIRTQLAKFGLGADDVFRPASTLSPGERTRAVLALFQAEGVNFLILDEPTNHLDLPAIEQLESALKNYDGTLALVTHDRRMLNAVTVNRRLHVEAGQVHEAY